MNTIALFEEKHVRRAWDQSKEQWYFSIDDVVEVLTGSTNVKDYIKKLRKRDPALEAYWGTNCPLVAMPGADGKSTPCAWGACAPMGQTLARRAAPTAHFQLYPIFRWR
jgi:hypothetical protein